MPKYVVPMQFAAAEAAAAADSQLLCRCGSFSCTSLALKGARAVHVRALREMAPLGRWALFVCSAEAQYAGRFRAPHEKLDGLWAGRLSFFRGLAFFIASSIVLALLSDFWAPYTPPPIIPETKHV